MSAKERDSIRGCRPSRLGLPNEEAIETLRIKSANIEAYARRVKAGLPIFTMDRKTSSRADPATAS